MLKSYLFKKYVIFYAIIVLIILVATGCKLRPEPLDIEEVSLSGTLMVGEELIASVAPTKATVIFSWFTSNDGTTFTPIADSGNTATYTLTAGDAGKYIKVHAQGIGAYSCFAESEKVGPVIGIEDLLSQIQNDLNLVDKPVLNKEAGTITISEDITINENVSITLPDGLSLVIGGDSSFSIGSGNTLTLDGNLVIEDGQLHIKGGSTFVVDGGVALQEIELEDNSKLEVRGSLTSEDLVLRGEGSLIVSTGITADTITVAEGSELKIEGNLSSSNNLTISGKGSLTIAGDVNTPSIELKDEVNVTIEGDLITSSITREEDSHLNVEGKNFLEELLELLDDGGTLSIDNENNTITISGNIKIDDDVEITLPNGMSLVVEEDSNIEVEDSCTLTINGTFKVEGNLKMEGNLVVTGDLEAEGELEIGGKLKVSGNVTVDGVVTGTLNVPSETELNIKGDLETGDNFVITGGGTVNVEGNLEGKSLKVSDGSTLVVTGDANLEEIELEDDSKIEIGGNLTTTNNLSIGTNSSVEAENNITVGRDLTVGSGATLDQGGELNVTGTISGTGEILEPTSVSWEVLNDKPLEVDSTLEALVEPSIASVTYQWMVADSAEGPYSDIAGATGKTYTLTESEIGKFIRVEATGTGKYKTKVYSSNPSNDVINRVAVKGVHALVNALLGSDDFEEYNSIVKWTNSENELFTITLEEDSSLTATSSVPEKVNLVVSDTLSIGNTLTIKGKLTANKQSDITLSADWWTIEGSGVATINSEAKLTFKNNNNYINGNNAYWTIEDGTIAKFTREADKDLITFSGIGVTLNKDYDLTTLSKTVNLVGDVRATLYAKLTVKIANLKLNDNSSLVISDNGTLDSNSMFGYEHLNQNAFIDIVNGTLKKDGDSWISSTGSFYYILENTKARRNQAGFELTPINTAETSTATFKNVVTTGGDKFSIVHTPFVIDSGVTLKQDGKWASGNVTIKNGATFIISKNEHYAVQKLGVGENPQTGVTKEDFMLTIEQGATLNFQGSGNINFVKGNAIFYGGIIDIKKGAIIVIGSTEYDTSSEGFEASEMIDELKGKILNHIAIYDDVEIEDIQHTNPK